MAHVIGIDLGTTNSVAAFKLAGIEVVTAEDNTPPDRKLTRSAVARQNGTMIVGTAAYNQLRATPEQVVVSVKRLIGRGFAEPSVQANLHHFHYKVSKPSQGTDNAIAVWLDGQEYSPEDISADILRQVAANATAYFTQHGMGSGAVRDAVITIPAYFNDKQRHATRQAAFKAGLNPLELLPEPTAAAISHGFSAQNEDGRTILVYDLGGGTFDASLITAAGNQFIEQGKAGDMWLGGDDFDTAIVAHVKQVVARAEGIDDIDAMIAAMPHYQRVRLIGDLKVAAEKAKVDLSQRETTRIIPATPLIDDLGMAISIDVELTRAAFEALIRPMVDRTVDICRQAVEDLDYTLDMVDAVLLVGGSSQIPAVQQRMREVFGDRVQVHPRPMTAVAEGAAIVANGMADKVGSVSRDYFIRLENNPEYVVIARNETLPVITSHIFKTVSDGQRLICMDFFNKDTVKHTEESVGKMWLGLDQYYPAGTEVAATFELDERSNALQITASLKHDPRIKVSRSFSRGHGDEVVFQQLETLLDRARERRFPADVMEEVQQLAVPAVLAANDMLDQNSGDERPDQKRKAEAALKELASFVSEDVDEAKASMAHITFVLDVLAFAVPPEQRSRLQRLKQDLEGAMERQDLATMQAKSEAARQELQRLPDMVNAMRYAHMGAARTHMADPARGDVLFGKVGRMIAAFERNDMATVATLWRELEPELSRAGDITFAAGSLQTGLRA